MMSKRLKIFMVFAACFLFASVGATALTLTQAKIMALEKNHDIRVWMLGVDAARGEHKSRSGVYDPEISFKASYADTKTPHPERSYRRRTDKRRGLLLRKRTLGDASHRNLLQALRP